MEFMTGGPTLPIELWRSILRCCSLEDLTRTSLVNYEFLCISRYNLYSKLCIKGYRLSQYLAALKNPQVSQSLCHVILDPTGIDSQRDGSGRQEVKDLFDILASQPQLVRLDIVRLEKVIAVSYSDIRLWVALVLATHVKQLPQLKHITLDGYIFTLDAIPELLQLEALKDVEINEEYSLRNLRDKKSWDAVNRHSRRPTLETFRIRSDVIFWQKITSYVDLSYLKRLAIWDIEEGITDISTEWGALVVIASSTLESLSLWINDATAGASTYISSSNGFPRLRILSLFIDPNNDSPHWTNIVLDLVLSFYGRSPLIQQIRLFVMLSGKDHPSTPLHEDQFITQFASNICQLNQIKSLKLAFHDTLDDIEVNHERVQALFQPIFTEFERDVLWDKAWPFFEEGHEFFY
ncbi:hypothetical protein DL96DRAFT_1083921 [Flagelloscypha sp. PMI_526]|nr:hypothetical protein DL96DRAFT_1083921 [Flagelloscypha sp. PMI_526]